MKKTWLQSISLFALLLVLVGHGYAQGIVTGSISGTIQDPTGAVVSSAKVSATNVATGITQTVPSKTNGDFTLSVLPIGLYKLQIEAQGFDILTLSNVSVTTGVVTGLGIEKLKLGSASESVEVSTAENLLETTQSMVTTTFDSVQVGNLPTGGGFDELALLIPGVVSVRGNSRSNTNGASISSNGQRGRNNNFELDGQSNNDNSVAGPQVFFSNQDAIQEIQVVTNNFGAQYGRDAGSVVNYITKSGTNGIHGTAFYSYEGSWLSSITQGNKGPQFGYCLPGVSPSTGCTAVKKPRFDNNTWGGSLGAPIIKNKLFGFGSALFANNLNGQTQYNSASVGSTSGYTPTPAGVAQLAAAFPNNAAVQSLVKFGPYAIQYGTLAQIPGSSANVTVSDGTTSATIPVSLYSRTFGSKSTDEEVLGRLDYQATSRDRIFVRYFYQKNPSLPSNATATGGIVNVTDIAHAIGGDWSHTFNSKVVNQLRYSFQQTKLTFDGGAFPNCTTTTFTTCPTSVGVSTSSAYRLPAVATGGSTVPASINSISSFGLSTSYPQGRIVKDNQVQDNLTLNLGKHSLTVGASYEFQNSPNVFLPNISGGFTFFGANGLLQDAGQVGLAKGNPNIHFTEPDIAAYVQDDWKVRSDLTLNLGMRWEFFGQSVNLLHDLSLANQTGSSPLWNTALPQSETVFPYTKPDYKHFEPRIGFAYNPAGTGGLVIRGGYSLSISPAFYNIFLNSYGSAPVVLAATITGCNNTTKICLPGGGASYASVHALDDQYLPTGGSPGSFNQTLVGSNFKQPVTQTYSLGIQKAVSRIGVVEVRYVGAHTSGDFQSVNANPAIGFAAGAFPSQFAGVSYCTTTTGLGYNGGNGRLDCNNGNIRSRNNSAFEIYNGLQTSIKTQAYHGLTANFGYTWSRTIDNASEIFGTNGAGTTVAFSQNPRDTNVGERGVSGNSFPNVTSLGLVYASPFLKQNHSLLGKALGGFQFNTIYLFNSGQPFTPYQAAAPSGSEANFCDYNFDSSFAGVSTCRPILANPNAPLGSVGYNAATTNATHTALTSPSSYVDLATGNPVARSAEHWLVNNYAEALALGNPYPGVGRNTLRGGSFNNMDASVFKNNKINERLNLQLQVTVFNLLNRAYYGAPDAAIEDAGSTFANFTGNGGSNRNVTLGGRIVF